MPYYRVVAGVRLVLFWLEHLLDQNVFQKDFTAFQSVLNLLLIMIPGVHTPG